MKRRVRKERKKEREKGSIKGGGLAKYESIKGRGGKNEELVIKG